MRWSTWSKTFGLSLDAQPAARTLAVNLAVISYAVSVTRIRDDGIVGGRVVYEMQEGLKSRRPCPKSRSVAHTVRTIAAFVLIAGSGQAQQYNFQAFGADEGLDNMSVGISYQDRAGFLWVGTEGGLYRYDGRRFTKYSASEGLTFAWIDSIHESPSGELFVCGQRGLAHRVCERFQSVSMAPAKEVVGSHGRGSVNSRRVDAATASCLSFWGRRWP